MNNALRPVLLSLLALGMSVIVFKRAQAGGDHYFPPVSDPVVKEECGGCHLAFAPSMLPARSWQKMMGTLDQHFGDDASVSPAVAAQISRYLVSNAADTGGQRYGSKLQRGLAADSAPLRITELPKWRKEHREISEREWKKPEVRSKANCAACHTDAARGYYDD